MFRPYLFAALLAVGSVAAFAQNQKEPKDGCPPGPQHMRAAVRHIEAGGIGYNNGYSSLDLFFAADPNTWRVMPFLDLRGHVFNNGTYAANGGIGARGMWGCRAYGINGYYDFRNTHRVNYNQVAAGLETIGKLWDLRVNGYLPVGKKVSSGYRAEFAGFSGHSVLVSRKFQYAMKGIDGELGFHFGKTCNFDFYAAAGPYYFKGEIGDGAFGGKARVAGYYKDYVTLEVSDSWDKVFKNNVQGQVTLSWPFGPKSRAKLERDCCLESCDHAMTLAMRMIQPVARQEIIVLDSHRKTDPSSAYVVHMRGTSSSLGTYESPYATLTDAQDNSNIGDIIYVYPGDGSTAGMDEGIILQSKQKFWGSGVQHDLKTNLGKITIPALTSTSPIMTSPSYGVLLAADNEVSGFLIVDPGYSGIYGSGNLGNIAITSCLISGANQYGSEFDGVDLYYAGGSGVVAIDYVQVLDGVDVDDGGEGIYIEADSSSNVTVKIAHSAFSGNTLPIDLEVLDAAVMNATMSHNSISNNTNEIYMSSESSSSIKSSFTWNGNTIAGPASSDNETAIFGDFTGAAVAVCAFNNNSITNTLPTLSSSFGEGVAGIFVLSIDAAAVTVSANGNIFSGNTNPIFTEAEGTSPMVVSVINNVMSGNLDLLFVSSGDSTTPCTYNVADNLITGSLTYGLYGDFIGHTPVQFTATGNTFVGNGNSASFNFAQTAAAASTLLLSENLFTGNTSGGGVTISASEVAALVAEVISNRFIDNIGPGFAITREDMTTSSICLTLMDNASTGNTGSGAFPYVLANGALGETHFTLAPCDAASFNIGAFHFPGPGTEPGAVESCITGTVCP